MDKLPALPGALAGITQGKMLKPIFGVVYGQNGVGKTTLASQAPIPVYLGLEPGTFQLDVARLPKVASIVELLTQLEALEKENHPFKTIVIDTIDMVETLIWQQIRKEDNVQSIEDFKGGYGRCYVRELEIFRGLLARLEVLAQRFHVLLLGHVAIKTFQDPNQASGYDRYMLKVNERSAAAIREAVDFVLFATFKTDLVRGKTIKEVRALTDGTRVMYTEFRPAFDAKNRFGLPFEMPMEWVGLAQAIRAYYNQPQL